MTLLTTNKSATCFHQRKSLRLIGWLLLTFFSTICLANYSSEKESETPLPNLESNQQLDDALMNFQRTILMSKHRRIATPSSTHPVTAENVVTYPLPHAAIVSRITSDTPITMNYILNHAVNVPKKAETHGISIQNGTIIFLPGH